MKCLKEKKKISEILSGKELYIARFITAQQRPLAFLSISEIYTKNKICQFICCKRK